MLCCFNSRDNNTPHIMQIPERKVLLLGSSMIGKSTFAYNLFYNRKRRGVPRCTIGVDVVSIDLHGEGGKLRAVMWDCAGNPNYSGLGKDYWIDATHAIIFGSKNNTNHKWYYNALSKDIKIIELLDYDQDIEDFRERKDWLYEQIYD